MSRRNAPSPPVNSRLGLVLETGWRNAAPTEMKHERDDACELSDSNFSEALGRLGETIDKSKYMPVLITLPKILEKDPANYAELVRFLEDANFQSIVQFSDEPTQPKCYASIYEGGWKKLKGTYLGPKSVMNEAEENIINVFGPALFYGTNSSMSVCTREDIQSAQGGYAEHVVDAAEEFIWEHEEYFESLGYSKYEP